MRALLPGKAGGLGRPERALNDNRRMSARLSAFVIWALVSATAVFWALRLAVRAPGDLGGVEAQER